MAITDNLPEDGGYIADPTFYIETVRDLRDLIDRLVADGLDPNGTVHVGDDDMHLVHAAWHDGGHLVLERGATQAEAEGLE